uniref:T-complex-associated testis-expressed protein 1 n=1 Tax=Lygus hesperus TaxID=30085 RepID=A0A0A9WQ62_LYGHE
MLQQSRGEKLDTTLDFNGKTNGYCLNDDEVTHLAHILFETTDVRVLDLSNNVFTDRGCIAIAEVLRVNHSLEALYLDENQISAPSGEALYYALKINPQLQVLNLDHTHIPNTIQEDILSLLHINQTQLKPRVDMRAVTVTNVGDAIQFKSTDYFTSQT